MRRVVSVAPPRLLDLQFWIAIKLQVELPMAFEYLRIRTGNWRSGLAKSTELPEL